MIISIKVNPSLVFTKKKFLYDDKILWSVFTGHIYPFCIFIGFLYEFLIV